MDDKNGEQNLPVRGTWTKTAQRVCQYWGFCCKKGGLKITAGYGNNNKTL